MRKGTNAVFIEKLAVSQHIEESSEPDIETVDGNVILYHINEEWKRITCSRHSCV